ncbi:MAG: VOC family protein [Pseudomonadota bacterium]
MQQRLSIITLGVSDIARSKKFYDALGWQAADKENNDIIAYNLQHMTLALYPKDKLAEDAHISMNNSGYSNFTLAYNVNSEEEVNATLIEAQKAGAKIVKPAQKVFWGGYSAYFADPDNFLWEVAYNPFSTLGPNGEFQWGGL